MAAPRVSVDLGNVIKQADGFDRLASQLQERVTKRAVVTLARRLGPQTNRLIAAELNLSTRQVGQRVTVTNGGDYVEVTASGKPVPLSAFGAKWGGPSSAGATVQIFRDSAPRTLVSTFIRAGAVLVRKFVGSKRAGRLPVRPLAGPAIASLLLGRGPHQIDQPLDYFAQQTLDAEVARLVALEINGIF